MTRDPHTQAIGLTGVWANILDAMGLDPTPESLLSELARARVLKVIDAPWFKIIDGTGAFSTASAKLLRNRRFRSSYLGHAHPAQAG
jgi:predicted GTPase